MMQMVSGGGPTRSSSKNANEFFNSGRPVFFVYLSFIKLLFVLISVPSETTEITSFLAI